MRLLQLDIVAKIRESAKHDDVSDKADIVMDSLLYAIAQLHNGLHSAMEEVRAATRDCHSGGEHDWKVDIPDSAPIKLVLEKACASFAKIDSQALRTALDTAVEAEIYIRDCAWSRSTALPYALHLEV